MRIAIMGAGNVGNTLGEAWRRAGHEVHFGSRSPSADGSSYLHTVAAEWAEVIVFAVPGSATAKIAATVGPLLDGKTVIDASNDTSAPKLNSVAEIGAVAPGARVHRAFSTVGWEVMAEPIFGDERADLFYCGPEDDRANLDQLIGDVGFRPVWLGGPEEAETVDGLARAWFALALRRGLGRKIALRLLGV
jgi:predicted dinucleotide-binding enzyme